MLAVWPGDQTLVAESRPLECLRGSGGKREASFTGEPWAGSRAQALPACGCAEGKRRTKAPPEFPGQSLFRGAAARGTPP